MIVVYGDILVRAEEVAAITKLAGPFVQEVHKEEGCIAYELSWDVADPRRLRLLEHWIDEARYETHRIQPHVAEWTKAITAAQETKVVVTKLTAAPK